VFHKGNTGGASHCGQCREEGTSGESGRRAERRMLGLTWALVFPRRTRTRSRSLGNGHSEQRVTGYWRVRDGSGCPPPPPPPPPRADRALVLPPPRRFENQPKGKPARRRPRRPPLGARRARGQELATHPQPDPAAAVRARLLRRRRHRRGAQDLPPVHAATYRAAARRTARARQRRCEEQGDEPRDIARTPAPGGSHSRCSCRTNRWTRSSAHCTGRISPRARARGRALGARAGRRDERHRCPKLRDHHRSVAGTPPPPVTHRRGGRPVRTVPPCLRVVIRTTDLFPSPSPRWFASNLEICAALGFLLVATCRWVVSPPPPDPVATTTGSTTRTRARTAVSAGRPTSSGVFCRRRTD